MILIYLGLGGNQEFSEDRINKSFLLIESHPKNFSFRRSSIYETTPVSTIEQPDFLNCVVSFKTLMELDELFTWIEEVERSLGKVKKEKDAPRVIDIDILFYGDLERRAELEVPHPRWRERLFVLRPLRELTDHVIISGKRVCLDYIIKNFENKHNEVVKVK